MAEAMTEDVPTRKEVEALRDELYLQAKSRVMEGAKFADTREVRAGIMLLRLLSAYDALVAERNAWKEKYVAEAFCDPPTKGKLAERPPLEPLSPEQINEQRNKLLAELREEKNLRDRLTTAERERERDAARVALEDAFIAGFEESGEGCNGEYPTALWQPDELRRKLKPKFEAWLKDRALAALNTEKTT